MDVQYNRQNDDVISILKGIGIVLVVIGHSSPPSFILNFIYLFHVSLFFISSGYFFNSKSTDDKIGYIWKKIKGLYFPFVKYSIIFLLFHNLFYNLHIYNNVYGFNGTVSKLYGINDFVYNLKMICLHFSEPEMLLGALWFLESLFISSVFFLIIFWVTKLISKKYSEILLPILVLVLYVLGFVVHNYNLKLPFGVNREFILVSLIYLGYAFRKYFGHRSINIYMSILSVVFLLVVVQFYSISIVIFEFSSPYLFLFISMAGFYLVLTLSKYFNGIPFLKSSLVKVGNNTMAIFVFHFLSFKIISLIQIWIYGYDINYLGMFPVITVANSVWWVLYSCVGIIIPMYYEKIASWIQKKISLRVKS